MSCGCAAASGAAFYYLYEHLAIYRVHAGLATEPLKIQTLTAELLARCSLGS